MKGLFEHIIGKTPDDTAKFVDKSMDIADQIVAILKEKKWTQKDLAKKLGKSESEISKWLTGTHNFTLRSITNIETVLREDVIVAPMYWKEYNGLYSSRSTEAKVSPGPSSKTLGGSFDSNLLDKNNPFRKSYISSGPNEIVPSKINTTKEDYTGSSEEWLETPNPFKMAVAG